jgi:general secretion pathway protein A
MYLDFFNFREKPFNLTPDPRFIFLSKNHKETFAHLLYGINNRVGFMALTGEVGSGKTTVLRALLSQLHTDPHRTALIFNPCLSPTELLQNITREFGISVDASHTTGFLEALNQYLLQQNAADRTVVLVIDEAQNLEAPVLEQIRLISNLETDREKLLQIVLSGQPELGEILARDDMRQLSQRITVRYHLWPMDFQDTVAYIRHRLDVAGDRNQILFSRRALKQIYRYSRGLPRLINVACDRALLAGYTRDTKKITSRITAAGIKDMRRNAIFRKQKRPLILVPTAIVLAAVIAGGIYFKWPSLLDDAKTWLPATATEVKTATPPVITGEELSRAMADELRNVPESESARRAFNTLAGFWKAPPLPEDSRVNPSDGMDRAALDRKLLRYRFSGNLGALLRLDHPAALELTLPDTGGRRFIVLVGMDHEQLFVDSPMAGRTSFSFSEIERHWSGEGFLFWKDHLNLLPTHSPESTKEPINKLQGLLKETGTYNGPLTGVYDGDTRSAVKAFQSSRGIEADGIVGAQTLMLLYRSMNRFEVPTLSAGQK